MADQALIQSGAALYQQSAEQVDVSGAIQEGRQLITDQIDKNIKFERDQQKHEATMRAMQQQEELRALGLEEKLNAKEAQNIARESLLNRAIEQKIIDPVNYEGYTQQGDDFLKD